jgi:hypothetical protein
MIIHACNDGAVKHVATGFVTASFTDIKKAQSYLRILSDAAK